VARRQLPLGAWEVLVLDDYPQTTDDGHNTVQMGICPGDGTIHLSYDRKSKFKPFIPLSGFLESRFAHDAPTWLPNHSMNTPIRNKKLSDIVGQTTAMCECQPVRLFQGRGKERRETDCCQNAASDIATPSAGWPSTQPPSNGPPPCSPQRWTTSPACRPRTATSAT
jgi:hypothetical protein